MMKLEELQELIYEYGNKIGLPPDSNLYPMFSSSGNVFSDGGTIYIDKDEYNYIIMERGKINNHYKSSNLEDILYQIFKIITNSLASKYELEHRNNKEDSRQIRWKKQMELLGKINLNFIATRQNEIEKILKIAPYRD